MKQISVKVLSLLMAMFMGFGAVSCSNDDEPAKVTPRVSIERPSYALATDEIEVKVNADAAPESDIKIPLTLAGTAKEGVDFTMPSKTVTIKAGQTSGSFIIKRVPESVGEDSPELIVNLGEGDGYILGLRNFVTVSMLGDSSYLLSFDAPEAKIYSEKSFTLNVSPMVGYASLPAEDTFTLEVDPEASTAVEGTHFTLTKSVTVAANKRNGQFTVTPVKIEEGKDVIVLRISEKAGYGFGSNPVMTITLSNPENLSGTWAFKSWETETLAAMYGEDTDLAPKFNVGTDKLTLEGTSAEYSFTPAFTGDLKNYFGTGSRKITFSGLEDYLYQGNMSSSWETLCVYKVPDVNIKFSAKESEKRTAYVGLRLITVDKQEVLEMVIDDFSPVEDEFWGQTAQWMAGYDLDEDHPADPNHNAAWFPYQLQFTRVK